VQTAIQNKNLSIVYRKKKIPASLTIEAILFLYMWASFSGAEYTFNCTYALELSVDVVDVSHGLALKLESLMRLKRRLIC
jgi:hypothetical protein